MVDPTLHGLYIPLFFGTVGFFKIRSWNMPNSGCSPWLICNARFRRLRFAHDHLRYKIRGSRTQNITIPSFYTARMKHVMATYSSASFPTLPYPKIPVMPSWNDAPQNSRINCRGLSQARLRFPRAIACLTPMPIYTNLNFLWPRTSRCRPNCEP